MMNAGSAGSVRKFNPGTLQSDEELKRQFVVRRRELDIVLDVLRSNVDAVSCQHMMIVAPRGMGKTMLLARVAAELRTDGALAERLLPVRFMEESLEIFDLGDFWLEALFQLAREVAGDEPELAEELTESRKDLSSRRGIGVAEQAFATVADAADRLDRRIVFMVENMQDLCRDVDDDFGWKLRGVLQTEPWVVLLGTATTRFADLESADKAFFELFRFLDLRPLDTDGCRRLWGAISGDDAAERTVRPLEILTGGSPRLLVMVAQFARHRSLRPLPRQLMEELVILIDEHTEYFRGHLEVLPKGERRVYVSLIDLWRPSSTGEIAERARMDVRATSTLLGRLVTKGLVGFEGTGQRRRYAATERLYAIYYKLRRERDEAAIVFNLIRFMAAFYSGDGLNGADPRGVSFTWRARCLKVMALVLQQDEGKALEAFRAACASFAPSPSTIHDMTRMVSLLVPTGVSPSELLDSLLQADENADALAPLKAALEQECGRDVRAPAEVLEVASDIRKGWAKAAASDAA